MVLFDQLRISDDGKKLYIAMHVNKAEQFENVYLESITIVPAIDKTATDQKCKLLISETSPTIPTEDYIYYKTFSGTTKEEYLVISKTDLDAAYLNTDEEGNPIHEGPTAKRNFGESNFSSNLFFVYVKCTGLPDECVPCYLTPTYTLGVTFDENMLYQKVMGYTKELTEDCTVPMDFTDFILQWNAFKASIETEHYIPAVNFFCKLFGNYGQYSFGTRTVKPCGCHG